MDLKLTSDDARVLAPVAGDLAGRNFIAWLDAKYHELADALVTADNPEMRGAAQALKQLRDGLNEAAEDVAAADEPPPPPHDGD